jgi:prepilin-type N-terminal cleavage/methylation domain-containing protein
MKIKKINSTVRAFTLIELLVVIAIIGILSGVVIVNLNSARQKGQDAAIKNQVAQIRSSAIVYQDDNNNFSTVNITPSVTASAAKCSTADTVFASSGITAAITGITGNAGSAPNCAFGTVSNASGLAASWVLFSSLRSSASNFWCVDSSGNAKVATTKTTAILNASNEVVCP